MLFAELLSLSRYASHTAVQFCTTWHSVRNITLRTNKATQIPAVLPMIVCLTVVELVNKSILNDMEVRHYGQSPPLDHNRSYNYSMLTQRDQVAA